MDFQLQRQLRETRARLTALERFAAGDDPRAELDRHSRQLQRLEVWQRALTHGRPIRSEAQIYAGLRLLESTLEPLRKELQARFGVEAGRMPSASERALLAGEPALPTTGTFSGTVTGSDLPPPQGLEGVFVDIFDANGEWVANALTDSNGDYTSPALAAGTYYAWTVDWSGYVNELYDDVPCYFICTITADGTPITVSDGSDTPDIDFELDPGGTISGTITDADGGAGLPGVIVDVFDSTGNWVTNPATDANGDYRTPGLPAGTSPTNYFATTFNDIHYLDELYREPENWPCPFGCDPTTGTAIEVTVGNDTAGIDFDLVLGGIISGSVSEQGSGTPIPGPDVWVDVFDAAGNYASVANIDGSGVYTSWRGLPTGSYFARTLNIAGYLDELYSELPCLGWCDVTAGTSIPVTEGATTSPINFTLEQGGTISGTVTEVGSGPPVPIPDTWVEIYDAVGNFVASDDTDAAGFYRTPAGLPTGSYFARTFAPVGYVDELYDDIPCLGCDVTGGTSIVVAAGATTPGIDFQLTPGGLISGTVTEVGSGTPIQDVHVEIYDANGDFMTFGPTDAGGDYTIYNTLLPGTYYALALALPGHVSELHQGIACPSGCVTTAGTPISITGGANEQIDFDLAAGGSVSGTVTEVGTGLPIADIHVEIWSTSGHLVWWEATEAGGDYTTAANLPPGSYFVKTWNDQGYINELYDDLPCAACDAALTSSARVTVTAGGTTSGIDFDLASGGSISGTVTVADPNDVTAINVQVFDDNGDWVWSVRPPTTSGEYSIAVGLPTGTYYVRTASGQPYVNEVWNNQPCLACDVVTDGDPVAVTAPNTTSSIDFSLDPGVKLTGTIKDGSTQLGINDSMAEIFTAAGERVAGCGTGPTGDFTCRQALPNGTYFAATANYAGYIDELYSDPEILCVGGGEYCDVTQGTPIVVNLPTTPDPIHMTLDRGGWFTGSVIDETWRRGLAPIGVFVYDSAGNQVADVTWPRPRPQNGSYTTCGLPTGTYYAVTDSSTIGGYHADELYDDRLCVLGCNVVLNGTPISVVSGSGTSDIDFALGTLVFADGFESGDSSAWSRAVP